MHLTLSSLPTQDGKGEVAPMPDCEELACSARFVKASRAVSWRSEAAAGVTP